MTQQTDSQIAAAQDSLIARFSADPASACDTKRVRAEMRGGLACRVGDGQHEITTDMPAGVGGGASAPPPGFFGRAAIASCIAVGLKLTALREGVTLEGLDVEIETDFDNGALLGVGPNSAAPLETRIAITFDSSEPAKRLEALAATALESDPWFLALREAQKVATRVAVVEHG